MNGKQNFGVNTTESERIFDSMTLSSQRAEPDNISACGCYFWRSERQWSGYLTSLIINKVNTLANHDWRSYEPIWTESMRV